MRTKKKIGIVLSGGAIRGFAHLGVLQALGEHKVEPDIISGASAGAIIGTFIAAGYTPKHTLRILSQVPYYKSMHWLPSDGGFADLSSLKEVINQYFEKDDFSELKKALFVSVTNLSSGHSEILNKGNLSSAVMASAAIPILFKPIERNGQVYVDGGLLNNLPIEPLIDEGCDLKIAVDVNASFYGSAKDLDGLKTIGERCFHVVLKENTQKRLNLSDITISVSGLADFSMFDFKDSAKIFDIGYETTLRSIDNGLLEDWL